MYFNTERTNARVCFQWQLFALQQVILDEEFPSIIALILMTSKGDFSPLFLAPRQNLPKEACRGNWPVTVLLL